MVGGVAVGITCVDGAMNEKQEDSEQGVLEWSDGGASYAGLALVVVVTTVVVVVVDPSGLVTTVTVVSPWSSSPDRLELLAVLGPRRLVAPSSGVTGTYLGACSHAKNQQPHTHRHVIRLLCDAFSSHTHTGTGAHAQRVAPCWTVAPRVRDCRCSSRDARGRTPAARYPAPRPARA